MQQLLSGMIVMGYIVSALFFWRFWRLRRDRLFRWFALAFAILAGQRFAIGLFNPAEEDHFEAHHPGLCIVRLLAFVLILIAILEKNMETK